MASLLDIADSGETVHGVPVKGVSARGIAYLLARFPEMRLLMAGREAAIDVNRLMALAPEAVAAVIAVGCGYVPDGSEDGPERQKEAEDKAGRLNVAMQADFVAAIIRATLPGGVGPFVKTLESLSAVAGDAFSKGPATNSDTQS